MQRRYAKRQHCQQPLLQNPNYKSNIPLLLNRVYLLSVLQDGSEILSFYICSVAIHFLSFLFYKGKEFSRGNPSRKGRHNSIQFSFSITCSLRSAKWLSFDICSLCSLKKRLLIIAALLNLMDGPLSSLHFFLRLRIGV